MMKCFGIESTAHTLSIGIVDDKGNILADQRSMYQTEKGGIIPVKAAEHHENVKDKLIEAALKEAKLSFNDIDIIAISQGPGLPPCLHVGMRTAKELAKRYNKPLIGVNHIVAHLEIGRLLTKAKDPVYVFVSGANTQIIALEGGRYRIFGETLSIGLGNALDKLGRALGLGFPAGPKIEELAKKGKWIDMPYTVKGMDVEFSGLVTYAINKFRAGAKAEDICFSFQETAFAMLTETSERAMAHCEKKEALIIGGVAANKRLYQMLEIMCKDRNSRFYAVPAKYSGDQGVQIAWLGVLQYPSYKIPLDKLEINPRWRIDDISVD